MTESSAFLPPADYIHFHAFIEKSADRLRNTESNPAIRNDLDLLRKSSIRVWHDTLNAILAVQTVDLAHARTKSAATRRRREFGAYYDLKENFNVTTLQRPSEVNDLAYWQQRRRCAWPSCGCAFHEAAHRRMRVCKGCWRVLYCNKLCQRS